ncbi:hypothetical protein RRG08_054054 [Elysia crispata]|uniref:Uncharacterized protein n=1 Tax=Elysia crispata TaxID=231223 RepID=A0AAE1DS13_9GAST|nr:hypothetical protein RRG08_054054 [Elysia crispata]
MFIGESFTFDLDITEGRRIMLDQQCVLTHNQESSYWHPAFGLTAGIIHKKAREERVSRKLILGLSRQR